MNQTSIRYYSRSKKKNNGRLIPMQVCVSYNGRRLRVSSMYVPELTAEELALIGTDGLIKQPLPPTKLSEEEIKQLQERMLNNRAFWCAVVDSFAEAWAWELDWQTITLQDLEQYLLDNFDFIASRANKYRRIGRCK